jgi:hypothetical protein
MKRLLPAFLLAAAASAATPPASENTTASASENSPFHRGEGSVLFSTDAAPGKPVVLRYYIPQKGDLRSMPVLFCMHGAQRTSDANLAAWRPFADLRGFVILAPEYSKKFYDQNAYQFVGVLQDSASREPAPRTQWTSAGIEAMFDFFKKNTGNTSAAYDMFGHSAGAQFVHRHLLAWPGARVRRAVAANPSSWTYPLPGGLPGPDGALHPWPYSLKGAPLADAARIRAFLARDLTIALGNADNDPASPSLDRSPGALAQGPHRLARGLAFFLRCEQIARDLNTPFNWKIVVVPGVAHSGRGMVLGQKNGAPLPCGAFRLLFEN